MGLAEAEAVTGFDSRVVEIIGLADGEGAGCVGLGEGLGLAMETFDTPKLSVTVPGGRFKTLILVPELNLIWAVVSALPGFPKK